MSSTVSLLERATGEPGGVTTGAGRHRATVEELRAELTTGRFATTRPVPAALAELFPGKGMRRGASYVVPGSTALALALLAEPTRAGSWCAVVGMPGVGAEAAAGLGVDLDRLVLVPRPGQQWLAVVGALADAFDVVAVHPGTVPRDADQRRLAARLRERGTTLLVTGSSAQPWPGAELRLEVTESAWHGLGFGHGHLAAREVTVGATGRSLAGRPRQVRLWLPDRTGRLRVSEPEAELAAVRELAEQRAAEAS